MNHKKLVLSSVFPASAEVVFTKLQDISTLQIIAKPLMRFKAVEDTDASLVPEKDRTYRFYLKIFNVIPFGIHTIHVIEFDPQTKRIYTHESNPSVSIWNHRITLEPLDPYSVRYTDEVEIYAGWKTSLIYLWSRLFYSHRQKKWRRLLRRGGFHSD